MTNITTAVGDQSIVDQGSIGLQKVLVVLVFSDFQRAELSPMAAATKTSGLESWVSHYLVVLVLSVRLTNNCIQNKVECIFPIVVVSILCHTEIGRNDHREDASHFIVSKRSF